MYISFFSCFFLCFGFFMFFLFSFKFRYFLLMLLLLYLFLTCTRRGAHAPAILRIHTSRDRDGNVASIVHECTRRATRATRASRMGAFIHTYVHISILFYSILLHSIPLPT